MTDEEILNKAKETSDGNYIYEQGFVYGFELGEENGRKDLEKEIKQITEREHVVPEHYLCEMIKKSKELEEQNKIILEDNDTLNKWVDELKQYCDCMYCKHCDDGDEFTVEGTNETLCVYCINHKKQNFEPIDKE